MLALKQASSTLPLSPAICISRGCVAYCLYSLSHIFAISFAASLMLSLVTASLVLS